MSDPLFTPFDLGGLVLPNRIVMAPMTRNRADRDVAGASAATYYAQRASAGLIVTESTQVSPQGVGYANTPGVHSAAQVAAWRRVTDAVHARGGRIYAQLVHAGRISHPVLQPGGELPVAPSAVAAQGSTVTYGGPREFPVPRALERWEIPDVVEQFARGARGALEAGFDGVEVHGGNGYLVDQFLRDGTNRRTDAYGGSIPNRARFALEVADAVAAVWGAPRVGVRISPWSGYNSMGDSDPAALFTHLAGELGARGLGYLHVIEPVSGKSASAHPRLTPALRARFGGPVIANGGHGAGSARASIAAGEADLVSFATHYIANPDLVERFAEGAPLATPERSTYYGGDDRGYVDYPVRDGVAV